MFDYYIQCFNGIICCLCVFKLADDRMALVSGISLDPEAAIGVTKKLPPKWIEGVDEVEETTELHHLTFYKNIIPALTEFTGASAWW